MVRRALLALALLFCAAPAAAQDTDGAADLPAAVAEERITVSSDYRGSYITVFGVNPDRRARGNVVVVVRGPNERVTVMRKQRVFGLLVNGDPVRFSEAPAFFAVLSNEPLNSITTPLLIHRYQLDPAASAQLESAVPDADPSAYRAALVRLRRSQGLYQIYDGPPTPEDRSGLTNYPGGLFRAVVRLPANAPIAEYVADAYVFRDGRLVSSQRIPIGFARVGIEGLIHNMATQFSFLYGVLVVLIALGAGWLAALLFRRA